MPVPRNAQRRTLGNRTDNGRATRIAVEVPVQLRAGGISFAGVTRNVGPSGVFVATVRLPGADERVTLSLETEGDADPVDVLAEVRWRHLSLDVGELPVGVGLRFIDTPLRTAIFISELRRSARQRLHEGRQRC
jgi:hypothetical protein